MGKSLHAARLSPIWQTLPLSAQQAALRALCHMVAQQFLCPPLAEEVKHEQP